MRFSRAPPACRTRRNMDNIIRLLLLSLCGLVGSEPLGRLLQRRRDAFQVYAREFAREYEPYMFAAIPLHAPVPVVRVLSRTPILPSHPRDIRNIGDIHNIQNIRDTRPAPSTLNAAYARPYEHARLYAQHPLAPAAMQYADQTQNYPRVQHYPEHLYAEPGRPHSESTRPYAKPIRPYAAAEPDYEATSYDYGRNYARPTYYQKPHRQVAPTYEYAGPYDSYAPQPSPQLTYAIAPYDSGYSASQEAAPTVLYARPSPSGGFTYRRVPDETTAPKKKAQSPPKEKEKVPQYIFKIHKYRIVKDDLL